MTNDYSVVPGAEKKIIGDKNLEELVTTIIEVGAYFRWDVRKTTLWMQERNPMLGNLRPINMILIGRGLKVLQFVKNSKRGNHP